MSRSPIVVILVLVCLLASTECGEVRAPTSKAGAATYVTDIQPLLAKRCVSCHGVTKREGSYDLSSWRGLLGPGTDDVRNAIAGDENSVFLTKLDAARDPQHWGYLLPAAGELRSGETNESRRDADYQMLRNWVVRDQLAYTDSHVHPAKWVYPVDKNDVEFHGGFLRKSQWNTATCEPCHGNADDPRGGSSQKPCRACHTDPEGINGCTTCHGDLERTGADRSGPPADLSGKLTSSSPGVGAHRVHLNSTIWSSIACADCHKMPQTVNDPGHLFDNEATKTTDFKAEVTFSGRSEQLNVKPSYDSTNLQCTVYCHGAAFMAAGNGGSTPKWNAGPPASRCQSCHDHKTPAFAGAYCNACHQQSVTECPPASADPACVESIPRSGAKIKFIDPALHGDGRYPFGKAGLEGTCWACHGTEEMAGAPPPDLRGRNDETLISVGLHRTHLTPGAYSKGVPCETCHIVPKDVSDKGHIDTDLPAEITWSPLATGAAYNASVDLKPRWDQKTAACDNVYCHSLLDREVTQPWKWNQSIPISCGSCHGFPPLKTLTGKPHDPSKSCALPACHPKAYVGGTLNRNTHINGKVDL